MQRSELQAWYDEASTMNKEEGETFQKVMDLQSVSNAHGKDENKVRELTLETERLRTVFNCSRH